jgi:hypothetical protein
MIYVMVSDINFIHASTLNRRHFLNITGKNTVEPLITDTLINEHLE